MGVIHVRATISQGLDKQVFLKDGTKTNAGIRDIPISDTLKPTDIYITLDTYADVFCSMHNSAISKSVQYIKNIM